LSKVHQVETEKKHVQRNLTLAIATILLLLLVILVLLRWLHRSHRLTQQLKEAQEKRWEPAETEAPPAPSEAKTTTEATERRPYTSPELSRTAVSEMEEEGRRQLIVMGLRTWLLADRHFANLTTASVDEAALALQTNRTHLRKVLKEVTGQTLQEYLHDLQLEVACQLLEGDNDLKTETIAFECGMTRPSFFRLFKQKYQLSPMQYRERALQLRAEKEEAEGDV
jgi:AraC-like DNA-binding protein